MNDNHVSPVASARVIYVTQIIVYLIAAIPMRLWYKARCVFPNNLSDVQRGILVVANHQSFADPFFITFSLPFSTYRKLLPFYFPVADWVMRAWYWNPSLFPFLRFLGCFSIGVTAEEKMRSIFFIRELLKRGDTVMLFPEGAITTEETVSAFQQGIGFFARQAKQVLFARLRGFNQQGAKKQGYSLTFSTVLTAPIAMTIEEMYAYLSTLGEGN